MGNKSSRSSYPKPFSGKIKFDRNYVLGEGNSIVYRGTYKNKEVAVKRIELKPSKSADREFITQTKLDHQNVLKILTVEQDPDFRYIVLELCGGTLKDVCIGAYSGPNLPSDQMILKDIAIGLNYIHSNKLVHRDIKPENILISSTIPVLIKLSDFGLSKETSASQTYTVTGPFKGTWKWMAPEQLVMMPNSYSVKPNEVKKRGTCKSDVFSAGLVFFYFVTRGVHPYGDATNGSDEFVVRNIRVNHQVNFYKLRINHFATAAIKGMIQSQPDIRTSLEQVIKLLDKPPQIQQSVPVLYEETRSTLSPSLSIRDGRNVTVKRVGVKRAATFTAVDRQITTRTLTRTRIISQDAEGVRVFRDETSNSDF